jgi:tetratricopeptide (TPR) repeat protein
MSLIHDALKKAQEEAHKKEGVPLGSGVMSMGDAVETGRKLPPTRTLVLAGVLVVALGVFAYMRFVPKDVVKPEAGAGDILVPKNAETIGKDDVGMLKKRAVNAFKTDDLESAWSSLSTASNLDPKDPEIWNNLGLVAKKRGDAAKARECYQKALDLKPQYPEAMNNMAMVEMEGGNLSKAMELLEGALKITPAYPEANFNLALLYEQKGDKKKAVEYYKRFLEVGGDFPSNVIDKVRDRLMEIEQ